VLADCIAFCGLQPPPSGVMATIVDWAQIVGAVGSVLAIVVSFVALSSSRRQSDEARTVAEKLAADALVAAQHQAEAATRQLIHDRKVQLDLAVVRDLIQIFSESTGEVLKSSKVNTRAIGLVFITHRDKLPYTCAALGLGEAPKEIAERLAADRKASGGEGEVAYQAVVEMTEFMTARINSTVE
jgi:hypothetical protein